ncbi:MAG: NAD(P)H-hydrate dehydratase [Polaromonas sp.]|nr:NAD(P)H-hydrate dehydratase [Polaromonas sp.]
MKQARFRELDLKALAAWPLPGIDESADKEARGSVLVIAGSREIPGAALLSATAAARAGAGKLLVAAPASVAPGIALAMPEARVIALKEDARGRLLPAAVAQLAPFSGAVDAVLAGPGLPSNPETAAFVAGLLRHFQQVPVILDAAAMDVVLHHRPFSQPVLLTPHCGEMAHLTGHTKEALSCTAGDAALHYASEWQATVALKGSTSWIAAPDDCLWRHDGGHVGLAMSGSGDVLAGLIAGLAARGVPLAQACAWGMVVHGQTGCRLAKRIGPVGFLARELLPEIPAVLATLQPAVHKRKRAGAA